MQRKHNSAFCVIVESHVIVNYIQIVNVAKLCFYVEFVTGNNTDHMYQLFEGIDITANLYYFHTLHINAAVEENNVPSLMSFLEIRLAKEIIISDKSLPSFSVDVKHFTRWDGINRLRGNVYINQQDAQYSCN